MEQYPNANLERLTLWVKGLLSGEFPQGLRVLARNGKFCCLGVACEIAIVNGLEVHTSTLLPSGTKLYDGNDLTMPVSVQKWYGLTTGDIGLPTESGDSEKWDLASTLNDSGLWDFRRIAQAIKDRFGLEVDTDGE